VVDQKLSPVNSQLQRSFFMRRQESKAWVGPYMGEQKGQERKNELTMSRGR
jgi:hypothetical protein